MNGPWFTLQLHPQPFHGPAEMLYFFFVFAGCSHLAVTYALKATSMGPHIVCAIDVGMTCTGVCYAVTDQTSQLYLIQRWPGSAGASADKVSALSQAVRSSCTTRLTSRTRCPLSFATAAADSPLGASRPIKKTPQILRSILENGLRSGSTGKNIKMQMIIRGQDRTTMLKGRSEISSDNFMLGFEKSLSQLSFEVQRGMMHPSNSSSRYRQRGRPCL